MAIANCPGPNGASFQFEVHPIGTSFNPLPGIYIFVKAGAEGNWDPIYVGETGDFKQRLDAGLQHHQAWPRCCTYGATHIAVMPVSGGDKLRFAIETYLRHSLRPPANDQ